MISERKIGYHGFCFFQDFRYKLSGKLCKYMHFRLLCNIHLIRSMLLTVGCHVSFHARDVEFLGSAFREKQALYIIIYRYIMLCKFACQSNHNLDTVR